MRTKKMKKENLFRTHSFFNNSIAKSSFQGLRLELPPESELLADVLQFRRLPGTFDRRRFRFVFRNCPPPHVPLANALQFSEDETIGFRIMSFSETNQDYACLVQIRRDRARALEVERTEPQKFGPLPPRPGGPKRWPGFQNSRAGPSESYARISNSLHLYFA